MAELAQFLQAMGAEVEGIGMSTIRIEAPERLRGAVHTLRGDYIEAASWAVVGAVSGGEVEVTGVHAEDLEPIAAVLAEMQLAVRARGPALRRRRRPSSSARAGSRPGLWPGFPSDIVSLVTVLATQATGQTLVHDWLYELRLFALEQLSAMRADLFLCDPHRIIVSGPTQAQGTHARQPRHPVRAWR